MMHYSDFEQHKLDEAFDAREARRGHNRRVLEGERIVAALDDRINHCETWSEIECLWPLRAKVRAFFGGADV